MEISSSNFPRFDRNPNTGGRIADETRTVTATQTIFHDKDHPSALLLMVMPPSGRYPATAVTRIPRPARPSFRSGEELVPGRRN